MENPPLPILITGATGFLGSHLMNALIKKGHTVYSLQRKHSEKTIASGAIPLIGELADLPKLIKPQFQIHAIFHVAAKAGIWGPYKDYYEANVLGTMAILKAAEIHHIPHIIYTSTASVVFNKKDIQKGDESMPYGKKWLCHYAKTKAIAEKKVLTSPTASIKTIALRPHLIWGPGDPHLFPRLIEKSKKHQLRQIGHQDPWVDLTHVDNVVHAHLLAYEALQKNIGNRQAYFITQEEPIPLWAWIKQFLKGRNLPPPKRPIPYWLAYSIGYCLEKLYTWLPGLGEPPLTRFIALELSHDHTFSSKKAMQDLGYKPIRTFAEGMETLYSLLG